jgi:thiol-disulfide isomerase/thioredoxin
MSRELKYINGYDELTKEIAANVDKLIVFMFTAHWCGPCKRIKQHITTNKSDLYNNMVLLCIDVDENDDLCSKFNIESMPTFIFNVVDDKGGLRKLQTFSGADSDLFDGLVSRYTKYIGATSEEVDKYLDSLRK